MFLLRLHQIIRSNQYGGLRVLLTALRLALTQRSPTCT